MHYLDVDGFAVPKRIGGHVALDLCNTLAGWADPAASRQEWLADYGHLTAWATYAELVPAERAAALRRSAARDPARADAALGQARRLRAALHAAIEDPVHQAGLGVVTRVARAAAAQSRLEAGSPVRWQIRAGLELPLLAAGSAAADFLTTADLAAVRSCPGTVCGWMFLDPSGRRRWCSMAWCGNRAKVRAHAERARG